MVRWMWRCFAVAAVSACGDDGSSGEAETSSSTSTSTTTASSGATATSSDDATSTADTGSTGTPEPTGACDGPATDDYWLCLMALPMGDGGDNIGTQFRSQTELDAAGGGDETTYCFDGNTEADGSGAACEADAYASKQNAAKVIIPAGTHSIGGQPRPTIDKREGDVLITWDSWNAPEWYLGRSCADGGSIGAQKTFQVSAPAEGNASRWVEIRQIYGGESYLGGPVAGWNPVTSPTEGTDIAAVDARAYAFLGAGTMNESGDDLVGQRADFVIKKSTWTRYWALVELDQGDAWTCGTADGRYDLVSIWLADETQAPVQIYDRAEMEAARVLGIEAGMCDGDETFDDPPRDGIVGLWFEYNSSEGNCPAGGLADRIGYFRNFAVLHTPMPDGVIVAGVDSIVVADTEILIPPRP